MRKKKIKVDIQRWLSSDNDQETHYYTGKEWIFGFNPKFVRKKFVKKILKKLNAISKN